MRRGPIVADTIVVPHRYHSGLMTLDCEGVSGSLIKYHLMALDCEGVSGSLIKYHLMTLDCEGVSGHL